MKLIIKNLKQVTFEIEIPSEKSTILDLKNAIKTSQNLESENLKLLLKGSILDDSKTLEEYKLKDGDTIIMMSTKVKIKNNDSEQEPLKSDEKKEEKTEEKKEEKKQEKKPEPKKEPQYTSQINTLVEMGYDKAKAEEAIKAARGLVDIAIEFLTNGIPENLDNNNGGELFGLNEGEGDNEGEGEGEAEDDEADPLKKTASIAKIICQNNPSQLNILMQNIAQNDPDLFNLIKEREEEFKTLLEQPINEEDYRNLRSYQREMGIGQGEEHDEHDGHGTISVNLTPEDREVINRLKDLGNFNEADVVQAYFACDKNEEMTANYLFEHMYGQGNN